MTVKVTVDAQHMTQVLFDRLGFERFHDLMEQHDGAPEQFAAQVFPSILGYTQNPDPNDPDYVDTYTFEFADESEAVFFRMTS